MAAARTAAARPRLTTDEEVSHGPALLGGAGTFFGPFVGATAFLVLEDRLSAFTESWPLVIGAIFSAFVLFLPRGIWGTIIGGFHGRQSA